VVVADQELDGGGIGVVPGSGVQWKAEANGGDVQESRMFLFSASSLARRITPSSTSTGGSLTVNAVPPSSSGRRAQRLQPG